MQGEYLMAGNIPNRSVLVFTNNALVPTRAFRLQNGPYLFDTEPLFNDNQVLLAGNSGNNAWLAKIDFNSPNAPIVSWSQQFPGIASFRKVLIRPNGNIYALGVRNLPNQAPINVILRAQDNGTSLAINWLKTIRDNPENSWAFGDIVSYNGQRLFYTDGRANNIATFGNLDIIKILDDNDLTNVAACIATETPQPLPLPLDITAFNVPSNPQQMPNVAGGTNTFASLPMRAYCTAAPCDCKYENLAFTLGQTVLQKNFNCGAAPIDLPCPGQSQPIYFSGKLTCMGNCTFAGMSWAVKDPNGMGILTGSSATNPAFSIPITLAMTQLTGTYTIEISGKCGTKECKCVIQFKVKDCPKPCSCTPLSAFIADVNMGFNYFKFPAPSCKMQFTPKKLTDCDQVQWKVAKASDLVFTIVGNSVGNAPFQYTFPADLTQYVVCMTVTRTVPGSVPPPNLLPIALLHH
jgi:hypothetical protein